LREKDEKIEFIFAENFRVTARKRQELTNRAGNSKAIFFRCAARLDCAELLERFVNILFVLRSF
jgi:hypothetical protein